jgi:hypothetical protein
MHQQQRCQNAPNSFQESQTKLRPHRIFQRKSLLVPLTSTHTLSISLSHTHTHTLKLELSQAHTLKWRETAFVVKFMSRQNCAKGKSVLTGKKERKKERECD